MDLKQVAHCNALDIGFVWNLTLLRMMSHHTTGESHHTTGEKDLSAPNVAELTLLPRTLVKKIGTRSKIYPCFLYVNQCLKHSI